MKKTLLISIALLMVVILVFAGCSSPATADTTAETPTEAAETPAEATVEATTEEPAESLAEPDAAAADEYDPSTKVLAFNCWNKQHPVVQIMQAGFLDEAEKLGYQADLYLTDQTNLGDTVALGEQAIAAGVDGLVIYLLDEGVKPLIKKAADAGIPVVTGHTEIKDQSEWPGVVAWAACDAAQYAEESAHAIAEQVGGEGTVAVTLGSFNILENEVYDTFKKTMNENYPDIVVLDAQEEGFDTAAAVSKCTAIIQGNQNMVGAFSTTGGGAVAWSQALSQTGKTADDICVIGMDYTEQNLDLVRDGKVYAVVAQPLFEEHAYCVDLLDKILRGEEVPFDNVMDAPLITKDNVNEFYAKLDIVKEAFGQ